MDEKHNSKIVRVISKFIRSEATKRRSKGVIIGISRGLNSFVTAHLAVNTLGQKEFPAFLPDPSVTLQNDAIYTKKLAKKLGLNTKSQNSEKQKINF